MELSIIIPMYGQWHLTDQLLKSLATNGMKKHEIIISDDGSPDFNEVIRGVQKWSITFPNIKHVRDDVNHGFGRAHNMGVEASNGELLILLSNDVKVTGNFIQEVDAVFRNSDNPDRVVAGGHVFTTDTGWNKHNIRGESVLFPYVEGWLICCTRTLYDELEGFDERYLPIDCEDLDFSTMARQKGCELIGLNSSFLHHRLGGTIDKVFGSERRKITLEHVELFKEKWENEYVF